MPKPSMAGPATNGRVAILERYRRGLEEAFTEYGKQKDGGRRGATIAVLRTIELIRAMGWMDLDTPLTMLAMAIVQMEEGITPAMFADIREVPLHKTDEANRQAVKAVAAFAVDVVHHSGLTIAQSAEKVAKWLNAAAVPLVYDNEHGVSASSVINWRKQVRRGRDEDFGPLIYRGRLSQFREIVRGGQLSVTGERLVSLAEDALLTAIRMTHQGSPPNS